MKKRFVRILKVLAVIYLAIVVVLYFFQERLIFFPQKLDRNKAFSFTGPFEEMSFRTRDAVRLNGILFKADSSKGLIFYLHGNGGSLEGWGRTAPAYTALHYDVFMLDYRGYGKSEGHISSEAQLHEDIQQVYDSLKGLYGERNIVVLGYSIGTGLAARLAADNHPKMLILQAPYYSLVSMMRTRYPWLPTFILRYRLETNKYLPGCAAPIVIFHGDCDDVIACENSNRLKALLKPGDTLIMLKGQGHNSMSDNQEYLRAIGGVLSK